MRQGKNKSKKDKPVEKVRDFRLEDLPRDADGKVIIPEDITYAEFLHLTHPEMDEYEIRRAMAKERGGAWLVRLMVLAFIVLIVIIVVMIVTS